MKFYLRRYIEAVETTARSFVCPITSCVMTDPVTALDGHTYERSAIERWWGLPDVARRVIDAHFEPSVLESNVHCSPGH
jgi:hypothetical protein